MRRLEVLWVLGVALLVTLVTRLFGGGRRGVAAFRAQYAGEGLGLVDDVKGAQALGRCLGCGLCDRGEGSRRAAAAGAHPGIMTLVLASSRNPATFDHLSDVRRQLPREDLLEKESLCPARVPLSRLAGISSPGVGSGEEVRRASAPD